MPEFAPVIIKAMNEVKNFSATPEGTAITGGLGNILNLGLSALLLKKFFPGKATFGRAVFAGMCGIASTAAFGYGAVMMERLQNAIRAEQKTQNLREKIERLKARIIELTDMLEGGATGQNCSNLELVRSELTELRQRGAWLETELADWLDRLELAEEDMLHESRRYEKLVQELKPAATPGIIDFTGN